MKEMLPDWAEAVRTLSEAPEVALVCHVSPDGDALGSLLAASLGLRKLGKVTTASWGSEPVAVPPSYRFLPGVDSLVQPGEVLHAGVFVALDCGSANRLGELEGLASKATLINIDHHAGNECFGDLNLVNPAASSTAELVTALLHDLGVELDRDIATCLYTGVVTDTGRFQYGNSNPQTLRLAAELLAWDVPAPAIALEVFESNPFNYMKLLGRVLERATLMPDRRLVYSWVTLEDLASTGVGMDEIDKLIDTLRSTRDADIAAVFKEQADGTYRVSLRSKGPVSVGAIARAHGGGGHELAAAYTAPDVATGVEQILSGLEA
jgi:bifunctional oligoribonuclease and PAP phosphatase NrnA